MLTTADLLAAERLLKPMHCCILLVGSGVNAELLRQQTRTVGKGDSEDCSQPAKEQKSVRVWQKITGYVWN